MQYSNVLRVNTVYTMKLGSSGNIVLRETPLTEIIVTSIYGVDQLLCNIFFAIFNYNPQLFELTLNSLPHYEIIEVPIFNYPITRTRPPRESCQHGYIKLIRPKIKEQIAPSSVDGTSATRGRPLSFVLRHWRLDSAASAN